MSEKKHELSFSGKWNGKEDIDFTRACGQVLEGIGLFKAIARSLLPGSEKSKPFWKRDELYLNQHKEMERNLLLAIGHLEDAISRIEKVQKSSYQYMNYFGRLWAEAEPLKSKD